MRKENGFGISNNQKATDYMDFQQKMWDYQWKKYREKNCGEKFWVALEVSRK